MFRQDFETNADAAIIVLFSVHYKQNYSFWLKMNI